MSEQNCQVVERQISEGKIPLVSIAGEARDCGREYAQLVLQRYPGFRLHLDAAWTWRSLGAAEKKLVETQAPQVLEVQLGICDEAGPAQGDPTKAFSRNPHGCTAFSCSPAVTLDGAPISGQTKDTVLDRVDKYIVLRMNIKGAPSILALAYPGEILGYGFWSNGMSCFRNSIYSTKCETGMPFMFITQMLLSCKCVDEAVELIQKHGRANSGNTLISDAAGNSVSIETNGGGHAFLPGHKGINVHANHALGDNTLAADQFKYPEIRPDSLVRQEVMTARLERERGRITAPMALQLLAMHDGYPGGTCKHRSANGDITTAVVIAEPTRGRLHVVRGQPCCHWPVTYTL